MKTGSRSVSRTERSTVSPSPTFLVLPPRQVMIKPPGRPGAKAAALRRREMSEWRRWPPRLTGRANSCGSPARRPPSPSSRRRDGLAGGRVESLPGSLVRSQRPSLPSSSPHEPRSPQEPCVRRHRLQRPCTPRARRVPGSPSRAGTAGAPRRRRLPRSRAPASVRLGQNAAHLTQTRQPVPPWTATLRVPESRPAFSRDHHLPWTGGVTDTNSTVSDDLYA